MHEELGKVERYFTNKFKHLLKSNINSLPCEFFVHQTIIPTSMTMRRIEGTNRVK